MKDVGLKSLQEIMCYKYRKPMLLYDGRKSKHPKPHYKENHSIFGGDIEYEDTHYDSIM